MSSWTPPNSLSPSRVESFLSCPLAFRFANIEKLPDPPTVATTRGSLVHLALEYLFELPPDQRTPANLDRSVDRALLYYEAHADYTALALNADDANRFRTDCRRLAASYLDLEDPKQVNAIGLELKLEASVGALTLRGIIDRLDRTPDGELVVTDYKTGKAPGPGWERKSLSGVHFYAFMCESVLGRRPAAVRLMYLKSGEVITATPSAQSTKFMTTRTNAVWNAVERACERDDFRPKSGPLCNYCSYRQWCPEFGGDPDLAATEAPVVLAGRAA